MTYQRSGATGVVYNRPSIMARRSPVGPQQHPGLPRIKYCPGGGGVGPNGQCSGPQTRTIAFSPTHRAPVRPILPPHRLGNLGDTSPLLFNLGTFPVTVDTASYALLGLAAILLVPVFVGPKSAKGRRQRMYGRARKAASVETTVGSILPWAIILAGGAYFFGNYQGGL